MSFESPELLWLLVGPLAALAFFVWRPGARVTVPGDHLRVAPASPLGRVVFVVQTMPAAMLAIAIVLAAGPRTDVAAGGARLMTNIEILLDVSGSMEESFGPSKSSKFDAAAAAILQFTKGRAGDAFGLTLFSVEVVHWLPLTKDLRAIECALPFIDPKNLGDFSAGTKMRKALLAARARLSARSDGDRFILLVTDGLPSDFRAGDPEAIAQEVAGAGISVFVVNVAARVPPVAMQKLGDLTDGAAFVATDAEGLREVFARIDAMTPERFDSPHSKPIAAGGPYALLGLGLAAVWLCGLLGLRYTPW